jgi:hypothetical protein
MDEADKIKTQIIGVDNPSNITNVKVLSGEVILVETVKQRIQEGQTFSTVDPETKQTVDVVVGSDGVLKMKSEDGTEKTLDKLPTFT